MVIGLTGGIGSGKSTVARLFELLGCALFNSDQVAKQVYFNTDVRSKVVRLLGPDAYSNHSQLNKAYISSKIFSDTILLHKLNAIIHPAVIEEFQHFKQTCNKAFIIKETALLFEAGLDKDVDKIIMVAANNELRIKRVMQRDGLSREEVQKKINSQMPQEEKIKKSHYIIYNNEEEFLIKQVLEIKAQLERQ